MEHFFPLFFLCKVGVFRGWGKIKQMRVVVLVNPVWYVRHS